MPKVSTCSSRSAKLRSFVQEFGEKVFSTDGEIFYCKLCDVKFTAEKLFTVQQHCKTSRLMNKSQFAVSVYFSRFLIRGSDLGIELCFPWFCFRDISPLPSFPFTCRHLLFPLSRVASSCLCLYRIETFSRGKDVHKLVCRTILIYSVVRVAKLSLVHPVWPSDIKWALADIVFKVSLLSIRCI
jgi:hypothetical protein